MSSLQQLREETCELNQMLPRAGLVTMHSGNASILSRELGLLLIKPSGMDYDRMTPASMVEVNLRSGQATGLFRPSVDLPHHLFLYRNMPDVHSIIHTHSNHATAFAAVGKPIPLCLTAIADEFGGEVPCAPYVGNEGDQIGQAILKYKSLAPAILLANHGVFAWGKTGAAALKAAVMVEDVARTVLLARQLGEPKEIPAAEAQKWYDRYHNRYGQVTSERREAA